MQLAKVLAMTKAWRGSGCEPLHRPLVEGGHQQDPLQEFAGVFSWQQPRHLDLLNLESSLHSIG